jgi:hypothetical protein
VSRRTMHRWLVRYEGDGLEGLNNRSHRPAQSPHQMPPAVEAMVLEMRRSHPDTAWGDEFTSPSPCNYWVSGETDIS